jgi:hypothetical protein
VLEPHGVASGHPTVLGLGTLPATQGGIHALAKREPAFVEPSAAA